MKDPAIAGSGDESLHPAKGGETPRFHHANEIAEVFEEDPHRWDLVLR